MNNYEFYAIAISHVSLFFTILAFSCLMHFFLFRSSVKSIFDPYFLPVISSVFCFTVVSLLYFTQNISSHLFLSYLLTQAAFILGFYTFPRPKRFQPSAVGFKQPAKYDIAFYFFSMVYLISQMLIYALKGIPLFMESRLETFASGGGTGIIGRVSDVSSIFSIYAFFLVIRIDRFRNSDIPKYAILSLIFLTFILSGSKGSFLVVLQVFWCFIFFGKIKGWNYQAFQDILKKNLKYLILVSLLIVTVIIMIQSSNNDLDDQDKLNPLLALMLRFVHSGDVYWYAYPENVYLQIPDKQWFAALFNDTLGLLRVMDWNLLPEAIGITLKNIHHPSDIPQGPNARHNIFGLIYYGFYGSLIFSFLVGVTISAIRNFLPRILAADMLGGFIFTYLFYKISAFDTDPMLTITYINNIVFIFPILYIMYLFVAACFTLKTKAQ